MRLLPWGKILFFPIFLAWLSKFVYLCCHKISSIQCVITQTLKS